MSRQDADKSELDRVVKPGAAALLVSRHQRQQHEVEGGGAGPRVQVVDPVAAQLPGSPRAAAAPLGAHQHQHQPEPHRPSLPELELGEALHPDINEQHGHPGMDCWELPKGHAHRLPAATHGQQHPHADPVPRAAAAVVQAAPREATSTSLEG